MATSTTDTEKQVKLQEAAFRKELVALEKIVGNEYLADFGITNKDGTILIAPQLFPTQNYEALAWYDYICESIVAANSAVQTRFQSILQTTWEILSDGTEEIDSQMIELIEKCFYKYLDFEILIRNTLKAITHGYSVNELLWDYKNEFFVPVGFHYRHQSHFQWFPDGLHWMDNTDKMGDMEGVNLSKNEAKFLIHKHNATDENPYGQSIIGLKGVWNGKLRQVAVKQHVRFCESYGLPYTKIKLPQDMWNKSSEMAVVTEYDEANKKMKRAFYREGMEIDVVSTESGNAQVFMDLITYIDNQFALDILGQSTTASDAEGGSYAKSKVAKQISAIIIRADCKELEVTVNKLIKTIIDFNFPEVENYPYIKYKTEEAVDATLFMNNVEKAVNLGLEVGVNTVREVLGIPEPAEGEQVLTKSQSQSSGFPFESENNEMPQDNLDSSLEEIKDIAQQSDIDLLTSPLNQPFKKKINRKRYTEGNNNLLYFNLQSESKRNAEKMQKWEDPGIKKIVKAIQPWLTQILDKVGKIKEPEKLLSIIPDNDVYKKLEKEYFDNFTFMYLYGQDKARKQVRKALEMSGVNQQDLLLFEINPSMRDPSFVLPFEQAIQFFQDKIPMTPEELNLMTEQLRYKAFWMSRYNTWDALNKVYELLNNALQQSIYPQQWLRQNEDIFSRLGFDTKNPYYLENVFRTNVITAFNAGQYKQMSDPYVSSELPIWQFIGVDDARQSDVCSMMDGKIARYNDPIWNTYYPPLHYNCRSTVIAMSKAMAQREGLRVPRDDIKPPEVNGEQVMPIAGFDRNTAADWVNTLPDNKANMPDDWLK